jgi:hypothetical protein
MTTITDAQRTRLARAFASPALRLSRGLGAAGPVDSGERCTIAEINLVLTGTLSDDPHPCISEVIRRWVIAVQDAMPDELRNSPAWRSVAPLIAGTATDDERVEQKRRDMIVAWMWDRLADEAVLAALPDAVRPTWDRMLAERTSSRAYAAYAAAAAIRAAGNAYVDATHAAYAHATPTGPIDAVRAAARTTGDQQAYWCRADPAGLLARLVAP